MTPHRMIANNDCLRTCIASLLDLGPIAVPNFMEDPNLPTEQVWANVRRWLATQGMSIWFAAYDGSIPLHDVLTTVAYTNPDCYYIVGGHAAYSQHVVIALNDKIVHDPSRLSPGLTGPDKVNNMWMIAVLISDKMIAHK